MTTSWITQLGNWNPQLLREFRGRLKQRSFLAAIALSILIQGLILLLFFQDNQPPNANDWQQLWKGLTWIFPYALFAVGSFYLVTNLTYEEQSGTLNFIRLSPRPAWQILLGKLLGVPILPLIAIGLFFPLHLLTALLGNVPMLLALSYYLLLGTSCLLCWSLAMLFGFVGSHRTGFAGQATTLASSFAAITVFLLVPVFTVWNSAITWRPFNRGLTLFDLDAPIIQWLWTPLNTNPLISHGFTLINMGIILCFIWRIMLRRFRRPRSTQLSRRQSYGIMAYLLILGVGFLLAPKIWTASSSTAWEDGFYNFLQSAGIVFIGIFTYLLCLFLMGNICPQRQAILEWSRQPKRHLADFIWSDQSPAIVSFAVLLIIANSILIPLFLLFPFGDTGDNFTPLARLVMLLGFSSTVMLIGAFMQYLFTLKLRNPSIWFIGSLLLWWVVPPVILGILGSSIEDLTSIATIWTFVGYPIAHIFEAENLPFVILGILGQWGAIAFLLLQLRQSLYRFRYLESQESSSS